MHALTLLRRHGRVVEAAGGAELAFARLEVVGALQLPRPHGVGRRLQLQRLLDGLGRVVEPGERAGVGEYGIGSVKGRDGGLRLCLPNIHSRDSLARHLVLAGARLEEEGALLLPWPPRVRLLLDC